MFNNQAYKIIQLISELKNDFWGYSKYINRLIYIKLIAIPFTFIAIIATLMSFFDITFIQAFLSFRETWVSKPFAIIPFLMPLYFSILIILVIVFEFHKNNITPLFFAACNFGVIPLYCMYFNIVDKIISVNSNPYFYSLVAFLVVFVLLNILPLLIIKKFTQSKFQQNKA